MRTVLYITSLAASLVSAGSGFGEQTNRPLLIQWGQTTPDTRLMRRDVAYWEGYLPFDGIVIPLNQQRYAGRYGHTSANILDPDHWPLAHRIFDDQRVDPARYLYAIDDLKATPFKKFKHNFLLITCYPKMNFAMDWFSDEHWSAVEHDIKLLARIAKQGGCVGLWMDTEQYGPIAMWNYPLLREVGPNQSKDYEAYRKQIRKRGRQFIGAINAEFPGCHFGLAYGTSAVHWAMAGYEPEKLAAYDPPTGADFSEHRYGMLAHFVDGLIEGADANTEIIDGYELSYYYKRDEAFSVARPVVHEKCKAYSAIPQLYGDRINLALGLYPLREDRNQFTPDEAGEAVRLAMKHTDRYVWIWNEASTFWIKGGPEGERLLAERPGVDSNNGDPAHLTGKPTAENVMAKRYRGVPQAYIDAVAKGKAAGLSASAPDSP